MTGQNNNIPAALRIELNWDADRYELFDGDVLVATGDEALKQWDEIEVFYNPPQA